MGKLAHPPPVAAGRRGGCYSEPRLLIASSISAAAAQSEHQGLQPPFDGESRIGTEGAERRGDARTTHDRNGVGSGAGDPLAFAQRVTALANTVRCPGLPRCSLVTMAEGRRLQKISLTSKDPVKLRRAIVVWTQRPEFTTKLARILQVYDTPPTDGRVVCVDEFVPLNLLPLKGRARRPFVRPRRLRATSNRNDGVRHMLAALDLTTGRSPIASGTVSARRHRAAGRRDHIVQRQRVVRRDETVLVAVHKDDRHRLAVGVGDRARVRRTRRGPRHARAQSSAVARSAETDAPAQCSSSAISLVVDTSRSPIRRTSLRVILLSGTATLMAKLNGDLPAGIATETDETPSSLSSLLVA